MAALVTPTLATLGVGLAVAQLFAVIVPPMRSDAHSDPAVRRHAMATASVLAISGAGVLAYVLKSNAPVWVASVVVGGMVLLHERAAW